MQYYRGIRYQRGRGLGSLFSSLFRQAMPIVKRGIRYLGKQALQGSLDTARDVMEGTDFKTAARRNLRSRGNNILDTSYKYAKNRMSGRGIKRKRKVKRSANKRRKTVKRKTVKRKKKTRKRKANKGKTKKRSKRRKRKCRKLVSTDIF